MGYDCDLDDPSRVHSTIFRVGTYEQGSRWALVFCGFPYLERGSFDRFRLTAPTKSQFSVHWRVDIVLASIVHEGDA